MLSPPFTMTGATAQGTSRMRNFAKRIMDDQAGATAIEYALVASLIAMSLVSTFLALGGSVTGYYETVANDYLAANQIGN